MTQAKKVSKKTTLARVQKDGRAESIRAFLLKKIPAHPSDIVAVTSEHFQVSRTTVLRHLGTLQKKDLVVKTGTTKQAAYALTSQSGAKKFVFHISKDLSESDIWYEHFESDFKKLSKEAHVIAQYSFTEMFNNAIDHSGGKKIEVETNWHGKHVDILIKDTGVGVFQKIKEALKFDDLRESVLHLTKGKFTTDPSKHSGEGIFFTSRAVDEFVLVANGLAYVRDNGTGDWFVQTKHDQHSGTGVLLKMSVNPARTLTEVFASYQDPESFEFNKTHIVVQLSKFQEERLISRSQAKRITLGLERFHHVILDFRGVDVVGQGFVDEIFRVYQGAHPDIKIDSINANEDIEFMIKRGLATAK